MKTDKLLEIKEVLTQSGLKNTKIRSELLKIFLKNQVSLTQADILESLKKVEKKVDRVSVYRNLTQMKRIGLIHELDTNQYILCEHECSEHQHLLLVCQKCQKHQEIKDHKKVRGFLTSLSQLNFFGKTQPLSLKGLCKKCSEF